MQSSADKRLHIQWKARAEKAKRELASSVEHANEGWNGKLDAERERDEWRTTAIESHKWLAPILKHQGQLERERDDLIAELELTVEVASYQEAMAAKSKAERERDGALAALRISRSASLDLSAQLRRHADELEVVLEK